MDQANALLWRMNPRRLDVESFRDSILRGAGTLNETMYGPSEDLDRQGSVRRTVYGRVSRVNLANVLRLYDFPDPAQTSPGRDLTTTSLQQLFVMNSGFLQAQAAALAKIVAVASGNKRRARKSAAQVRALYRRVLAREPSAKEMDLAADYLDTGRKARWTNTRRSCCRPMRRFSGHDKTAVDKAVHPAIDD